MSRHIRSVRRMNLCLLGSTTFFASSSIPALAGTWTTYRSYRCAIKNFPNCKIVMQVDMDSVVDRHELTFATLRGLRVDSMGSRPGRQKSLTASCSNGVLSTTTEFSPEPFTFYRRGTEWWHQEHIDAGYRKPMRKYKGLRTRTNADYDRERNNLFCLVCGN